jgi:dolichyl-diphosphooligosaccharide--protein glycosyltransferase
VVSTALAALAVVLLAFYPNVAESRRTARRYAGPSNDWIETLDWVRENTPAPVPDPADWSRRYARPAEGERYPYPGSFYSVMNWWDYGYWILTESRRIPVSIPTQTGAATAGAFYLAQSEEEADAIMSRVGARYVFVDHTLPLFTPSGPNRLSGKFRGLASWVGRDPDRYYENVFVRDEDGELVPRTVYYPDYFRSMITRLYRYQARGVSAPASTLAVAFRSRLDERGRTIKEIVATRRFEVYDEALAWVADHVEEGWRIVSDDAFASCVPLEPLRHYRKVHGSPTAVARVGDVSISSVEVYEHRVAPVSPGDGTAD